jgi:hypothetical protein
MKLHETTEDKRQLNAITNLTTSSLNIVYQIYSFDVNLLFVYVIAHHYIYFSHVKD